MGRHSGFTLVELMITVAIVAILGAIAVPLYRDYSIRAQVAEGYTAADGVMARVKEALTNTGIPPADRQAADLPANPGTSGGRYVDQVDIQNGTVLIRFGAGANETINGRVLALQPYLSTDKTIVAWRCAHAVMPGGMTAVAGSPSSSDLTTFTTATNSERYLPRQCRSAA